ncbi:MAG: glycosyltransferase family 4 protein [Anaerohalosphaera sp.]|nr:glycosyltransferase family 4 protein [Anaerohalosphaera sp.]
MSIKTVKVCFVMPKAYPLFNPKAEGVIGGAEVDLYYLSTELAKDDGFEVSFIVADYGQNENEVWEGVNVIKSLSFRKNGILGAIRIWSALKVANADVYMTKTASLGVPLIKSFCRLHKRRFVYRTAHKYECDGTYSRELWLSGKAFAWSLQRADKVFAQNVDDSRNLQKTIGVESVVLGNGHRLPKLGDCEKKTILWVGRTADFKKPDKYLSLARQFPDEHFVMICQHATGDDKYDELLTDAAKIDNLQFHTKVPFTEVDAFFATAKILVNTSDSEGFANTFIQAAKAAAAILTLNVNPDGFLNKYDCGKCAKGDQQQLATDLTHMLKDDNYIDLGLNGRKYAQANHDITKIVEQYKKTFHTLASSRTLTK